MDDTSQRLWAEQLVKVVNKVFPEVRFSSWQHCQRYLPHALTCAALVERWNIVSLDAARLLEHTGSYLLEQAHYQLLHALPLYKQEQLDSSEMKLSLRHMLAMYSHAYPDRQIDVASIVNDLALLSHQQNNYILTEPLLLRSVSIYEQIVGSTDAELAECLSVLANLYESQGKLEQAAALYTRALRMFEVHHLDDNTCDILRNMAWLALAQGHFEEAESLYQRALHLREKIVGPIHPEVAQYLEDYALALKKAGKQIVAMKMEEQAKAIRTTLSHKGIQKE